MTVKAVPTEMPVDVQVDVALDVSPVIDNVSMERIVNCVADAVGDERARREMCIRICDADESRQLNATYRDVDKPTNVLSFAADLGLPEPAPLGDLAICWPVVVEEAELQGKSVQDHFCHLVVHGLLHLLGYDHIKDADAEEMERLEVSVLRQLDIDDPYLIAE